jgi:hypothetical protein
MTEQQKTEAMELLEGIRHLSGEKTLNGTFAALEQIAKEMGR